MQHFSYIDTARKVAAGRWGKRFESDEEAQKEMCNEADLSGACLLSIVNSIDSFMSALFNVEIRKKVDVLQRKVNEEIYRFVAERRESHGPCPPEVYRFLKSNLHERIGRYLLCGSVMDEVCSPDLPPKGSIARKEYDKWMKRKSSVVQKEKSNDSIHR
jgi:hypothetical protein